jgi:hypothetical protein
MSLPPNHWASKCLSRWSGPTADLQIICLFKHKLAGDTYQGAAKETDEKLGGMLSALRNRGEFVGESGETFLRKMSDAGLTHSCLTRSACNRYGSGNVFRRRSPSHATSLQNVAI